MQNWRLTSTKGYDFNYKTTLNRILFSDFESHGKIKGGRDYA